MTEETIVQDEVQSIKERLDLMGVKYHHNAKLETLRALLDSSLASKEVNTEVIPRILLNSMRDRKYLQVRSIKTRSGAIQENVFVPEFQIVELPPLTPDELKELAEAQRNTLKD